MLRGQRFGLRQKRLAVAGELQRVPAPVGGGGQALREAAPFQPVQQPYQPRSLDAERAASSDCDRPGLAPITTSTENCAGLISMRDSRRMKVLEHPDLHAAHEIAEPFVENAEVDHRPVRAAPQRLL